MSKDPKTLSAKRPIKRESLMTLEVYAKERKEFRARVIEHKRARTLHLGEHVTLLFEDELTIRYQIQEMLRIEKIFDEDGIEGELAAYNPLIPDGNNFKATMLIEYDNTEERQRAREAQRHRAQGMAASGRLPPRFRDRRRGPRA
jgi:uncharacterized protein DUF3501